MVTIRCHITAVQPQSRMLDILCLLGIVRSANMYYMSANVTDLRRLFSTFVD